MATITDKPKHSDPLTDLPETAATQISEILLKMAGAEELRLERIVQGSTDDLVGAQSVEAKLAKDCVRHEGPLIVYDSSFSHTTQRFLNQPPQIAYLRLCLRPWETFTRSRLRLSHSLETSIRTSTRAFMLIHALETSISMTPATFIA